MNTPTFISEYHAKLDPTTSGDPRFELRLRVFQELAPKDPDALAVQYTRYDDMTPEQRDAVEALGRKGVVVIRERQRGVVGHGLLKPTETAKKVEEQIPFKFGMGLFIKAWQKLQVRPEGAAVDPALTDERYCTYDSRPNDYGYTEAYVMKLVRELSTEAKFRALLGRAPKDKVTGDWVGEPPTTAWPPLQSVMARDAEQASA